MLCMKCGREVALGQAFCKDCLEDMAKHPVSPGTPVQIPTQPPVLPSRRNPHTKKAKKPEEQIIRLRKVVRLQNLVVLILLVMLIALGCYTVRRFHLDAQPLRPGENYLTTEVQQQSSPVFP